VLFFLFSCEKLEVDYLNIKWGKGRPTLMSQAEHTCVSIANQLKPEVIINFVVFLSLKLFLHILAYS